MQRYSKELVKTWCQEHGWTDLFIERHAYWAFPPGAVMPLPIPRQALKKLAANSGWSLLEKIWYGAAIALALLAIPWTYLSHCPMPLIFAFAFGAIAVALMEED